MKKSYLSWKYRQEVLIANPSSTDGFQGTFVLAWKPGMKRDFRDLRFSDLKGNKIEYFLESISYFKSCRVWLALPANAKNIYMHYGNGGVKSGSNSSAVFEFYDGFSSLDLTKWTKVHGSSVVSGGVLTLESTTLNSILQSIQTYPVNTIVEARAYHANTNRSIIGYRNTDTEKAAAWHGATLGDNDDHRFTHNGSSGTWTDDGVNRGGSTYYIYGVAHLTAGDIFYINYAPRGTASTTLPGNVALPIHFYSEYNKGPVKVDWVRVRKYSAVEPTITLGNRCTTQPKAYPFDNSVTTDTSIGMTAEITMKYFLNLSSQMGLSGDRMFRHPKLFISEPMGLYKKWKYKGDIRTPLSSVETLLNVNIRALPGMALDGRDIRFSDTKNNKLSYWFYPGVMLSGSDALVLTGSDGLILTGSDRNSVFECWVQVPANTTKIHFYYGNGLAHSESDPELEHLDVAASEINTNHYIGSNGGPYRNWKYEGNINIQADETLLTGSEGYILTGSEGLELSAHDNLYFYDVQLNVNIPLLPGMTLDGRDIRFSTNSGTRIPYYLESILDGIIRCIVKVPAGTKRFKFYYGNGIAKSESSPVEVFDYWDDFDTLDPAEWSVVTGAALCTGSTLRISHATENSLIRSVATYDDETILEMRVAHPYQNRTIMGYWAEGNKRICWLGAHIDDSDDYLHTMDGTNQTNVDDGVTRAGAQFNIYGIAYRSTEANFYVNYALRGTLTTTLPSEPLPISLYSEYNEGDLTVDWVRTRKYTNAVAVVGSHSPRKQTVYAISETFTPTALTVERHYPQRYNVTPYYEYIAGKTFIGMQVGELTYRERRELRDYSLISCDISKSTDDTYIQLSGTFADLVVPPEKSTVKYIARDPEGNQYILFSGKVVANSPTLRYVGSNLNMRAADNSRNLAVQKIPWTYQTMGGGDESWAWLVRALLDTEMTGVQAKNIINTAAVSKQFVFDPKTSRLEAIQKIAAYIGGIINIKLISKVVDGITVTEPYFYLVPPEYIDEPANGFDLPDPITFTWPDNSMLDEPVVTSEPDEKYNKVIVYGTLSDTNESVVAAAYSPAVYLGEEKAREYIIEDNSITEKGSTAEREAIKWLIYFMSPRATVSAKFVNRFDFELYQRVRFGAGFPAALRALTNSVQMPYVVAFDPRDEPNSTHIIDVLGVPSPEWLRVSAIKYHSENMEETCELTLITDYIYASSDPVINPPYSDYLSPGYRKPIINDPVSTTQSIVDGTISKQLQPETCTVLSINTENKTAVVQTSSGKLVTIQLPS